MPGDRVLDRLSGAYYTFRQGLRVREDTSIPMTVSAIVVYPTANLPVVLLEEPGGRTKVPITIGVGEASAIATELDHIERERPVSHQLTAPTLAKAGASVVRVVAHIVDRLERENAALRCDSGVATDYVEGLAEEAFGKWKI